jgi:hypothetical protein
MHITRNMFQDPHSAILAWILVFKYNGNPFWVLRACLCEDASYRRGEYLGNGEIPAIIETYSNPGRLFT